MAGLDFGPAVQRIARVFHGADPGDCIPDATADDRPAERLAALLKGETVSWAAFGMAPTEFLRVSNEQGVTGLILERLRTRRQGDEWPRCVREALDREVRVQAARELLHYKELRSVVDVLAADGLSPILFKGTALAYSLYAAPSSRPRVDTDLLVRHGQVNRLRVAMAGLGYTTPPYCDGDLLFCQFPLLKTIAPGVVHRFDCHWKISTQPVFADVLTFDEVSGRSIALPSLGAHARTLAPLDALLMACLHPVMHHRNAESLIWTYDIHLLASSLSERDFERFGEMAVAKQVSAICAHQLRAARAKLGTRIPDSAIDEMTAVPRRETSAVYLRPNRRWIDELISGVRGLPQWSDRLRLLCQVAFPGPTYMLEAYGFDASGQGRALLPFLYLHRLGFGVWKLLSGRK